MQLSNLTRTCSSNQPASRVPPELILMIIHHLPLKGLIAASGVSKHWRTLVDLCASPRLRLLDAYRAWVASPTFRPATLPATFDADEHLHAIRPYASNPSFPVDIIYYLNEWPRRAMIDAIWPHTDLNVASAKWRRPRRASIQQQQQQQQQKKTTAPASVSASSSSHVQVHTYNMYTPAEGAIQRYARAPSDAAPLEGVAQAVVVLFGGGVVREETRGLILTADRPGFAGRVVKMYDNVMSNGRREWECEGAPVDFMGWVAGESFARA